MTTDNKLSERREGTACKLSTTPVPTREPFPDSLHMTHTVADERDAHDWALSKTW